MTDQPQNHDLSVVDWQPDLSHYMTDQPIPSQRDEDIGHIVDVLTAEPQRREALTSGRSRMLDVYAERMASLAVRNRSPDVLRRGLRALALAGIATGDWRDEVVVMAPLWRSAELIGLDPEVEFRTVGTMIGGKGGDLLVSFSRRTPANQTLQVMGYVEGMDQDGFRFRRTW